MVWIVAALIHIDAPLAELVELVCVDVTNQRTVDLFTPEQLGQALPEAIDSEAIIEANRCVQDPEVSVYPPRKSDGEPRTKRPKFCFFDEEEVGGVRTSLSSSLFGK